MWLGEDKSLGVGGFVIALLILTAMAMGTVVPWIVGVIEIIKKVFL